MLSGGLGTATALAASLVGGAVSQRTGRRPSCSELDWLSSYV